VKFGAYIDGFNLYYALKRLNLRNLYWLDIQSLSESLTPKTASLEFVNYYTSRSKDPRNKGTAARQEVYWQALRTLPKVNIVEGKILERDSQCEAACKLGFKRHQEKETDVKIGIDIIRDCLIKKVQGIILITADTDQVPTLQMVKDLNLSISVQLATPPSKRRAPRELTNLASKHHGLFPNTLRQHVMPNTIQTASGRISKPARWQ